MATGNREDGAPPRKRPKRKNNSHFLRNARGFAKQGIYGRGTTIADDQYTYFINILDAMKNGFEDVDEKVNMANNVFEQTKDQEVFLASNQIVCKVLEALLGFVEPQNLERFFTVFAENFRPICSDRFASHVLQKMVEIAFLRAVGKHSLIENREITAPIKRAELSKLSDEHYNLETEYPQEHKQNCSNFVERISKFMLNNLEDFVWDSCANHIMRSCILSLAGVHVPKTAFEKKVISTLIKEPKYYKVSDSWIEIMKEFPQRLQMWPQFGDLPYKDQSSGLLGVICIAAKKLDKNLVKHFGKKILIDGFLQLDDNFGRESFEDVKKIEVSDEEATEKSEPTAQAAHVDVEDATKIKPSRLPKVFGCPTSLFLLETLIAVAGPKLLIQIYAMLFAGRVGVLARDRQTNFSVQRLLDYIKEPTDFEDIHNELANDVEELLKIGNTGIVQALVGTCLRLATKQSQMIVALQTALHVAGDKDKSKFFLHCLIKLKPVEVAIEDKSPFVHIHGSLVVQHLLKYNKPIFLVNCILETPADQLFNIFTMPNGSHIVDAFMESKFIGEKSREKFIRHLEGFYVDLAIHKHGSRVIEKCFIAANDGLKTRIVKELKDKVNMLKGSPFGRLIYNKFRIETFGLSAAQWKASLCQNSQSTAAQILEDIVS